MKKQFALFTAFLLACGSPLISNYDGFTAMAQSQTREVTGIVYGSNGEPLTGAAVTVKGTSRGVATDIDGKFKIQAAPGNELQISFVGEKTQVIKVGSQTSLTIKMSSSVTNLDEVVVTALGIKKDKKSLGYAIEDINAEELMRNKSNNPVNSLSGKIAGVNITQSSGAAGAGSQIILRGGTSLERDNQPLFVVDGVIYDNSTSVVGNSAFDGMMATASTNSNRVMDINPEDIENMSVLKGPAAAALYGSRASAGVVIITTKKGKEGRAEVNFSTKYTTTWVKDLPETQKKYRRGFMKDNYDDDGNYTGTTFDDFSYDSWGSKIEDGTQIYDNIGDFFEQGGSWDTNLSVSGGNKNGNFFLSGSYFSQDGIIPTTGYKKTTFRFNGEQKFKMFTFGANVAYSQARTDKTLTSAGLYGSSGSGTMQGVYRWSPTDDMKHFMNEDGTRYRMFGDRLDVVDERDNPYWILHNNKMEDNTERFTGNFSIRADITDWWWISYRMGIDSYTTENTNNIGPGGVYKEEWQNGMYSENSLRYQYLSTNLMTNFGKQFGDFNVNLMLGTATDDTKSVRNYRMAWNFQVPGLPSFDNALDNNRDFTNSKSRKRLVGVFGEFRADWKNTVFLTVTGRNDWTSTLPIDNRSYFYPSVSGAFVFSELLSNLGVIDNTSPLTFGKIRASWAKVGKDTNPYVTNTYLWPVGNFIGGVTGVGNNWQRGNPYLVPEITKSTEIGLELRFFKDRLRLDYAYYTNDSYNQIMTPRLSNASGYILYSVNAGDVLNKGMELSISGTPIQTKDWTWETGINFSGNRGTVENLIKGVDVLYVTDVQVGNVQAASFNNGNFMAISGSEWARNEQGKVILDKNGMPTQGGTQVEIGNREPKFQGGWNNTVSWKGLTFNMLWEFRVGGHVYNGTQFAMTQAGVSKLTENRDRIEINGVYNTGTDKKPVWEDRHYVFESGKTYDFNGKKTSGDVIINNYYQSYYTKESANFMKEVNSLRLRTISLSYELPKKLLQKTKFIERASLTATANNLCVFSNYDGDPEVAAAGSGAVGSSSVGIDYCGVPSTASFSFGVNLTF